MPTHAERRRLPHSPQRLFDLVADIEAYPEFLPWCVGARITKREGDVVYADLVIGFKVFRERFSSKVTLDRAAMRIDVTYLDGPMRHLNNHWIFEPDGAEATVIDFYVDFEIRSAIFRRAMGALFNEAVRRMVTAFEVRARDLYGAPNGALDRAG